MFGETNFLDCMAKWNVNSHQLGLLKSPHNDFLWALAVNSLKLLASHIAKFTAWEVADAPIGALLTATAQLQNGSELIFNQTLMFWSRRWAH